MHLVTEQAEVTCDTYRAPATINKTKIAAKYLRDKAHDAVDRSTEVRGVSAETPRAQQTEYQWQRKNMCLAKLRWIVIVVA